MIASTKFEIDYSAYLTLPIKIRPDNSISSLESVLTATSATPHKIYLLINEYDNFANEVLMTGQKDYEALLYGEGLLKTIFKAVKAAASGRGVDRVFITGVSPVVLSDMTSGYNVGENIYLEAIFNDLCGFTEAEIAAVLERMAVEDTHGLLPKRWIPCGLFITVIVSAKRSRKASTIRH